MKGLMQFQSFDSVSFFRDKSLQVISCGPLMDYETKQTVGTKISVAIVEDRTVYRTKAGEQISNLFEKLNIKVPGKTLELAPGTVVELVDAKCVIYGDYRNQLSVTAADVRALRPAGKE